MVHVPWHRDFGPEPLRGLAGPHNMFWAPNMGVLGHFSNGSRQPIFHRKNLIFGGQLSLWLNVRVTQKNFDFSKILNFKIFWNLVFTLGPITFFCQLWAEF